MAYFCEVVNRAVPHRSLSCANAAQILELDEHARQDHLGRGRCEANQNLLLNVFHQFEKAKSGQVGDCSENRKYEKYTGEVESTDKFSQR